MGVHGISQAARDGKVKAMLLLGDGAAYEGDDLYESLEQGGVPSSARCIPGSGCSARRRGAAGNHVRRRRRHLHKPGAAGATGDQGDHAAQRRGAPCMEGGRQAGQGDGRRRFRFREYGGRVRRGCIAGKPASTAAFHTSGWSGKPFSPCGPTPRSRSQLSSWNPTGYPRVFNGRVRNRIRGEPKSSTPVTSPTVWPS